MFMIIALDVIISMRFSINCSTVICSHTVLFAIKREATSEIYGPGSIFYHISFRSTFICIFYFPNYIIKIPKIFILSYYLYQISLSQVIVKGLTTPLSRWLRGSCLFVQVRRTFEEPPTGLIPCTTKKYTSVMIRVCHSRLRFLSCMYIHDDFMTESRQSYMCCRRSVP